MNESREMLPGGNFSAPAPENSKNPEKSPKCVALGRPTTYNKPSVIAYICEKIACSSYGLHRILKDAKKSDVRVPSLGEIMQWLHDDTEFAEKYRIAKQYQADFMVDELIDIADDARNDFMASIDPKNPGYSANGEHIARTKLRLDTRKWCASKLRPKKYGEHSSIDINQEITLATLSIDQLQSRLASLRSASPMQLPCHDNQAIDMVEHDASGLLDASGGVLDNEGGEMLDGGL